MMRTVRPAHAVVSAILMISPMVGCAASGTMLDGREKSFLIVGYSTSYAWPDMLQSMLDGLDLQWAGVAE